MTDAPTSPSMTTPVSDPALSAACDRLSVVGIEAVGHHGVFDFERP